MMPGIAAAAGSKGLQSIMSAGSKGLQSIMSAGQTPVIGHSSTKTTITKHGQKIEQNSITIRAWEIAALAGAIGVGVAGVGAYEYLTGNPFSNMYKALKSPKTEVGANTITYGVPTNWTSEFLKGLSIFDIFKI